MWLLLLLWFLLICLPLVNPPSGEPFYQKLPYRSLTTRHYRSRWNSKTEPKNGKPEAGYYQNYHQYFDHPQYLRNFYFGHSQYGDRYQDLASKLEKKGSRKIYDLQEPHHRQDYPSWYQYQPKPWQQWHSGYIGYPWYYY